MFRDEVDNVDKVEYLNIHIATLENEVLPMIIGVLGKGENGITFETEQNTALKLVRFNNINEKQNIIREIEFQRELSKLNVAPNVHGEHVCISGKKNSGACFIHMDKIKPINNISSLTQSFREKLIDKIAISVYHGYVHNDLHWGNVAMHIDNEEPVLIDFGLTQKMETSVEVISFNQIVLSQLYALMDVCNTNNCLPEHEWPNCGMNYGDICSNDIIVETIYNLRNGRQELWNSISSL